MAGSWKVDGGVMGRFIFLLLALILAGEAQALTCTSVASKDWNKRSAWTGCNNGQPPTGADVVIASGTTILADTNTNAVGNITINAGGALQGKNNRSITLTGNFTSNGTFTPSNGTVAFAGTAQTITGNITFDNLTVGPNTVLTLAGNITINGTTNLTAANIVSTCPVNYTVTMANGTLNSCAGGGGTGGGGGNPACIPTSVNGVASPLIAGTNGLTLGTNVAVNGTAVTVVGTSSLPVTGTTSAANAGALPALTPSTFPGAGNGTLNANGTVAAGSYGTINASGNPTVFSGGTYYINTLNANRSIQLAAGTYYINTLNLSGNLSVTGAVQLFIGNSFSITRQNISLNSGGSAADLRVNLYSGAQFTTNGNDRISFTGLIYSPFSNSTVQFGGDTYTITGAVITAGAVNVGRRSTITFDAAVQAQLASVVCQNGPDHILISHTGSALTCSPQTVTLTACADVACTANYTGTVSGTLSPGGAAFSITNGTATAAVQQTTAGTATLSATAITPVPTAATPVACSNTATNTASCAMTFSNAGFVITAPNHVACTDATVTVEAMQAGTNNRCVPAYAGVTRAVNLSMAYANPASGTKSVTDITNNSLIGTVANAHNLAFDVNGKATLKLGYPDVGQVTLTASDTAPTGAAMSGSASFVAAPAALAFAAPASLIKAGNPFDAAVTAKTDIGTVCPSAVAAPNYGHETAPQLALTHTVVTGANPGTLSASTFTALTGGNGGVKATQSWDEAGVITLTANLPGGNYLGYVPAAPITVTSGQLTFIPDHFETAVLQTGVYPAVVPMNCPPGLTCPASYNGMVYSGQPFTVQVTARNLANVTTRNYQGTVARLVTLSAAPPNVGGGALAGNSIQPTAFANGVATTATPAYAFAAAPPADVYIRATDNDGVTSSAAVEGGVKVASGRFKISNAYGSERSPLPLNAAVQYYDGVNWVASSTDNSTSFNANDVIAAIVQGPLTTVSVQGGSTMVNGGASVVLNSNGVAGSADISINVLGGYLTSTAGRATFGVYKGGNEFIYQHERY